MREKILLGDFICKRGCGTHSRSEEAMKIHEEFRCPKLKNQLRRGTPYKTPLTRYFNRKGKRQRSKA